MQISIVGRHLKVTEPIKRYIDERLIKLEKYDRKIVEARAIVTVEKYRHLAEITVLSKNFSVVGKGQSNDIYTSVAAAIDKIEKQLKKHHERVKEHQATKGIPPALTIPEIEEIKSKKPKVIKRRTFAAKPMSLDEAKAELEVLNNVDFLVFRNANTEKVNVLYKQEDGNFGLIEET